MDKGLLIDGADVVLGSVLVTGGTGIVGWSLVMLSMSWGSRCGDGP